MNVEFTDVPVHGGRVVRVGCWRGEAGTVERVLIATGWASDPPWSASAVSVPLEAVPALIEALRGVGA